MSLTEHEARMLQVHNGISAGLPKGHPERIAAEEAANEIDEQLTLVRNMYDELFSQMEQIKVQLEDANNTLNAAAEDCHPAIERYFERWPTAKKEIS